MKKIKFIKRQDSGFKLSYGNSGETSLNLSNEIFDFISQGSLSPGEERDVTFRIYKEDCIKAMSFVIMKLPLYKSSSNYSNKVDNYLDVFGELYSRTESFFGANKYAEYKVSLFYRPDGRIYLKGLRINGFSVRDYLVENYSALQFDDESGSSILDLRILSDIEDNGEYEDEGALDSEDLYSKPFQQIYYGAPGTGKSHEINRLTEGKNVTRTTFHPDTDYSTFVGCYKPHMEEVDMTTVIGETLKVVKDEKGEVKKEKRIVYKYSCQAFLQAYIAAWQHPEKEHYLIIEEINRGNCAQIFGDIFQLLDRNWSGYSCYPIKADTDMEQELKSLFAKDWNMGEELSMEIDNMYAKHYPEGIIKGIKNGSLLLLPQNLFIWATMNTSDQSLFPIDSAFKRRWDWKYVKIAKGRSKETKEEYNWQVKFDYMDNQTLYHCSFQWWDFLNTINEQIAQTTSSDDKKLGYFFCKPKEQGGELIDAETFVGKVIFYLWNDVYKDESSELFKVAEGKEPSFDLFYNEKEEDGEWKVVVDTSCLKSFVDNVFKKQPDKVIVEADHQETEEKQESSVE